MSPRPNRLRFAALAVAFVVCLPACGGDATDCNGVCETGPHSNACRPIQGEKHCVRICRSDADCEHDYYAGCIGTADDGTKICGGGPLPPEPDAR
jgi:hypothetical protein